MTKLPTPLIWAIVVICVIPLSLNFLGIDFGTVRPPVTQTTVLAVAPNELVDYLHVSLAGSFTHTLLEWSAFCAAIFTTILAFSHFRLTRDVVTPIIGVALLCAGCMDAFHTLAADRLIEATAPNVNLIPFTWALCRLANILLKILGVTLLLVTRPQQWQGHSLFVSIVTLLFGTLSYLTIHFYATSTHLPQTLFPNAVVTRPWDVGPLILFAIAGLFIFPHFYRTNPSIFSHSLIISTLPDVVTQLHMSFGSSVLFDNHFNIAHFLKIVAYLVPLTGLILDYNQTYREVKVANQALLLEIAERQRVQASLEASERKEREKSQQLTSTLQELQQTQLQLIQGEKMSSLGQLVAGIAHEINNPINFIHGNLHHVAEYSAVLLRLAEQYQLLASHDPHLQQELEEADLPFIAEDLPKLVKSMQMGSDRIRQIVISLRNFSRLDESGQKDVNIHEGLDNTLLILQHRLKAHADRPPITITKLYGDLPPVECFPGQLNQVFMNILGNAIDALEGQDWAASGDQIPEICITTGVEEQQIRIEIEDNGPGISPETVTRIFDPFFTTKPVGKGTGMGLAISYQVITEKHQGTLVCRSELGRGTKFTIKLPMHLS